MNADRAPQLKAGVGRSVDILETAESNPLTMIGLRLEITRFVEEGQPNVVECIFIDSHGKKHSIIEKVPVVSYEELNADSSYPRSGVIACQVVQRKKHGDSEIVEIDTAIPWQIESIAGQNFFDVLPGQLIEF